MDAKTLGKMTVTSNEIVNALDDLHMAGWSKHLVDARNGAMVGIMSNVPTGKPMSFADCVEVTTDYLGMDPEPTEQNTGRLGVVMGAFIAAVRAETCTCSFNPDGTPASGCDLHGII